MKKLLILVALVLVACASVPFTTLVHKPVEVEPDPTFSWDPVTTNCDGSIITGVTYNVYIVAAPGPVPTVSTGTIEIPCAVSGIVDRTKVTPRNIVPITTTSFSITLTAGSYVVVVEGVGPNGEQGFASIQLPFTIVLRPSVPLPSSITIKSSGKGGG